MRWVRVSAVFMIVAAMGGTMACKAGPLDRPLKTSPTDKGPGSIEAARKYLEGRWSLVSFEVFPPGGQPIAVKGTGSLLYDGYGNLKMDLRTDAATAELLVAAGISIQQGVVTQEGRAAVDVQTRTLTYLIPGDLPVGAPSGPLATNRPRYWQVSGDILTLTTRDDSGKTLSVGRWQKTP
jgi:hypothetical protein